MGARGRANPSFDMTPIFHKKIFFSKRQKSKKSMSYQKKDGQGHAHPSFYWYDTDSGH